MKFLILFAHHGEGHKTAARNIRNAILVECPHAAVRIVDLFSLTLPHFNRWLQQCYSLAINQYTFLWKAAFLTFNRKGTVEAILPFLGVIQRELARQIEEFKPVVIVSTYPLYSFFFGKMRKHHLTIAQMPFITVVTDSITINSVWYRCPSDAYFVTDIFTANALSSHGVSPDKIHVFGFPVSLDFENIAPLSQMTPMPWKILFLPSARVTHSLHIARLLLAYSDIYLTVLAGKYPHVTKTICAKISSERLTTLSWSKQMPQLLASHHLFIGKAGGAIVQEAIAAQCPVIVSHLVPGQEEGNIQLIEGGGVGTFAAGSAISVSNAVVQAFANNATLWKLWKSNMTKMRYPSAARTIAKFLLKMASFALLTWPCFYS